MPAALGLCKHPYPVACSLCSAHWDENTFALQKNLGLQTHVSQTPVLFAFAQVSWLHCLFLGFSCAFHWKRELVIYNFAGHLSLWAKIFHVQYLPLMSAFEKCRTRLFRYFWKTGYGNIVYFSLVKDLWWLPLWLHLMPSSFGFANANLADILCVKQVPSVIPKVILNWPTDNLKIKPVW